MYRRPDNKIPLKANLSLSKIFPKKKRTQQKHPPAKKPSVEALFFSSKKTMSHAIDHLINLAAKIAAPFILGDL